MKVVKHTRLSLLVTNCMPQEQEFTALRKAPIMLRLDHLSSRFFQQVNFILSVRGAI